MYSLMGSWFSDTLTRTITTTNNVWTCVLSWRQHSSVLTVPPRENIYIHLLACLCSSQALTFKIFLCWDSKRHLFPQANVSFVYRLFFWSAVLLNISLLISSMSYFYGKCFPVMCGHVYSLEVYSSADEEGTLRFLHHFARLAVGRCWMQSTMTEEIIFQSCELAIWNITITTIKINTFFVASSTWPTRKALVNQLQQLLN